MSLLDANMVAFQTSFYMLITMGLLILAGNTCYPIFLRLLIWTLLKLMPKNEAWSDDRNTLRFLLDHPRRCYTNLFPSQHTWWLLISIVVLNGIDWLAFEILNVRPRPCGMDWALLTYLRSPDRKQVHHRSSKWHTSPRRALPSASCTFWRLLRRAYPSSAHWPASPIRCHDVHLRVPGSDHHAQFECLRGA